MSTPEHDHIVLVGTGVDTTARDPDLRSLAHHVGAQVAYLSMANPTLTSTLDEIAERDPAAQVLLVAAPTAGAGSPARSWIRRVAGEWARRHPDALQIEVAERAVTGGEAGLTSAAWERLPPYSHQILVCRGPRCTARGAAATSEALSDQLRQRGLDDDVLLIQTGCLFPCNHAPLVMVQPHDVWWGPVTADDAPAVVDDVARRQSPATEHDIRKP